MIEMDNDGVEGRFAGLPDKWASEEQAKIVVVPVPFDETTTYKKGSDKGPSAMIEASRHCEVYDIETDTVVCEHGIYTASPVNATCSKEMIDKTREIVGSHLKRGKFVVTLGGEHSISAAPIKAHADHYGPISILQFDAHLDLQPAYEGNPYSHASVISRVNEIEQVNNVVAVGIRSMGEEEKPFLDRKNTFFAHEIYDNDEWMDAVLDRLEDRVYVTFDLDVFDSSLMPSTGTPEPGGMDWYQPLKLLRRVAREKGIIGLDVVELCPLEGNHAPDFLAAKLIYKVLSYVFQGVRV